MKFWLLHGALGMTSDWDDVSAALVAAGHQAIAIDLEQLALAGGDASLEDAGKQVNALVDSEASVEEQVLVGYSLGGRIALHALLADSGGFWDRAVIVSAHPGLENRQDRKTRFEADSIWQDRLSDAEVLPAEFWQQWQAQPVFSSDELIEVPASLDRDQPRKCDLAAFGTWSLGSQQPLSNRFPEISVPVEWVVGEQDPKFRLLGERAVYGLRGRDHSLSVAPSCGHRIVRQAPEWLAQRLLSPRHLD